MKKIIVLLSAFLFLQSCNQKKETIVAQNIDIAENAQDSIHEDVFALHENEKNSENIQSTDPAKAWLESLFKCRNGNKFCFYMETEENATTERFYEFMIESEQIYGATNLSEEEIPLAKKKYKQKWSEIYSLRKEMEPWLFGRGQDDMENIKKIKIDKIADLKYQVFVDYDDKYQTLNQVTLVKRNNSYLIDYCDTEFID